MALPKKYFYSDDDNCEFILENYKDDVSNIDVLFTPLNGSDSNRNYKFVKVLNLRITLFGYASSNHLAFNNYSIFKLTNKQAASSIFYCSDKLYFYVKNDEFRNDYWLKKDWEKPPTKQTRLDAYYIFNLCLI